MKRNPIVKDKPTSDHVNIDSLGRRVARISRHLQVAIAAGTAQNDDDRRDALEGTVAILRLAYEEAYWIGMLPARLLNVPVPDGEDQNDIERGMPVCVLTDKWGS